MKLINEFEAAEYLGMKVGTLRSWRHFKRGPAYVKLHKCVRYNLDDVIKFVEDGVVLPDNEEE